MFELTSEFADPRKDQSPHCRPHVDLTSIGLGQGGGVEAVAVGVIEGLAEIGADPVCIVPRGSGANWRRRLREDGGQVEEVHVPLSASTRWQEVLRRFAPNSVKRSSAVGWIRRMRGSAVSNRVGNQVTWYPFHRAVASSQLSVVTVHDLRVFQPGLESQVDQDVLAGNIESARALVCSWDHPFRDLCNMFPHAAEKTFLIRLPTLNPGTPKIGRATPKDEIRLLYPGFVTRHKNHELVIRGMALDARLRLVCTGLEDESYAKHLRRLAERLGVAEKISWRGYVSREELDEEYSRADVLVMPSRWEAASGPIFEAVTRELPFVACRTPPVSSQLAELGLSTPMFDWDDPASFVDATLRTVADYVKIQDSLHAVSDRVRSRTWSEAAAEYLSVFDWVASSGPKPVHLQQRVQT